MPPARRGRRPGWASGEVPGRRARLEDARLRRAVPRRRYPPSTAVRRGRALGDGRVPCRAAGTAGGPPIRIVTRPRYPRVPRRPPPSTSRPRGVAGRRAVPISRRLTPTAMRRLDTITGGADRLRIGSVARRPRQSRSSAPCPASRPPVRASRRCRRRAAPPRATAPCSPPATGRRASRRPSSRRASPCTSASTCSRHDLTRVPADPPATRLPRASATATCPRVLDVDGLAFDRFWRFDATGLADARTATPHARFRVATVGGRRSSATTSPGAPAPSATSNASPCTPTCHGHGIGTALVGDSLDWCRRKGCRLGPGQHPGGQPPGAWPSTSTSGSAPSPPAWPCSNAPSTTDRPG